MIGPMLENEPAAARLPLLFLVADTGGGHRNAARAVGQALERMYPGRFAPALCDPLGGPGSARLLRLVAGLYGPATRLAPWLWGAAYHVCDSRAAMQVLRWALLRLADRPAAEAAEAHRPAAVVSFHPLTGSAAVAARALGAPGTPVVTVVTDLARMHAAWRYADSDVIIAPRHPGRGGWVAAGLPVTQDFWGGPLCGGERAILRRSLGLREETFLVLMTGGGEGSGGIAARTAAILRRFPDVDVVAVCGRNQRLKHRLDRLAVSAGCAGRLTVTGFTRHMADWLRACDLVVTKAGPGAGPGACGGCSPRSTACAGTGSARTRCAPRPRALAGPPPRPTSPRSSPAWSRPRRRQPHRCHTPTATRSPAPTPSVPPPWVGKGLALRRGRASRAPLRPDGRGHDDAAQGAAGGSAAYRSMAAGAGAAARPHPARDQLPPAAGRGAWPGSAGRAANAAALPVRGDQDRRLLGPAGAGPRQARDRRARPGARRGAARGQADHPRRRRGQELRLSRVLRARPPPGPAAARGHPGHPGRAARAAPGGGGIPQPGHRAVRGPRRDHRLAGRARGRRPARHGAFLAAVRGVRACRGRGGAGGGPGRPARPDERLPADVDTGGVAAALAHPGPG